MTVDDYEHIAAEIGTRLSANMAGGGFLAARGPNDEKMVIAIQKVQNLTNDIMSEPTRWYLMARVRDSLPVGSLSREKNVAFVIPAERLRQARQRGMLREEDAPMDRRPTHVMSATFRSVTRSTGRERTDLYYCDYAITDLGSGEVVWTDKVEFKRAASGRTWD